MSENVLGVFFAVLVVACGFLLTMRKDLGWAYDSASRSLKPAGFMLVAGAFFGLLCAAVYNEIRRVNGDAPSQQTAAAPIERTSEDRRWGEARFEIVPPDTPQSVPDILQLACRIGPVVGNVYFVVKPQDNDQFFVQERARVAGETCEGTVHIGRPGAVDAGKTFHVKLVAAPKKQIDEKSELPDWPEAIWSSEVLTLVRG